MAKSIERIMLNTETQQFKAVCSDGNTVGTGITIQEAISNAKAKFEH